MKVQAFLLCLLLLDSTALKVCLPTPSCNSEQPLCRSCLPGDETCSEPETLIDGFCGPYKDYSINEEITRRERYAACKDAALARAVPELREELFNLKHRFFYKNCIGSEMMCADGSCQVSEEECGDRGGVKYFSSSSEDCTSVVKVLDVNLTLTNFDEEAEIGVERSYISLPDVITTNELVKFCTYFYEVVLLGGQKQGKAEESYVSFLYNCFSDYSDFGTQGLVDAMNHFYDLSGQRAIRNLDTFDARNYPGEKALP